MRFACLLSLVAALFMSGCHQESEPLAAPERPGSVSPAALWVGGNEGGFFILVEQNRADQAQPAYRAEIRHANGELAYKGPVQLHPPGSYFNPSLPDVYDFWDGDRIYLMDGRYLSIDERAD
jgi:hypothetical protein